MSSLLRQLLAVGADVDPVVVTVFIVKYEDADDEGESLLIPAIGALLVLAVGAAPAPDAADAGSLTLDTVVKGLLTAAAFFVLELAGILTLIVLD